MSENHSPEKHPISDEFHFLKETIKDPDAKKRLIKRVLLLLGVAAAAGVVAAFAFALTRPVAERMAGGGQSASVDIPVSASSVSSGSGQPEEGDDAADADGTAHASGDASAGGDAGSADGSGTDGAGEGEENTELDAYLAARREISQVVAECEKSIVEVTGIRSEMDYFRISYENTNTASGVIIADDGSQYAYILTQSFATNDAEQIRVRCYNGTEADAERIRSDDATGLSVIRVPRFAGQGSAQPKVATLGNSFAVARADTVVALGNPMGYASSYSLGAITSNTNVISLPDCTYHMFTTDIKGSANGSGVLMNVEGEIIGIIDQSLGNDDGSIVKAIGVSELASLLKKLSNNEARPYAGITGEAVTASISAKTGIPEGVMVREVNQDSPAMLAGIKQQDVITKINGKDITTLSEYTSLLNQLTPGGVLHVTARRRGAEGYEELTFDVVLGEH